MKFPFAILTILAAATNHHVQASSSSDELEGELSIEGRCQGKFVEFSCEWEAEISRRHRALLQFHPRKNRLRGRELGSSSLDAEFVPDCEIEVCDIDEDDEDLTNCHTTDLEDFLPSFPLDFEVVLKEVDDLDDFYVVSTEIPIPESTGLSGVSIEVELELEDIDDVATYDDSDVGFSGC